MRRLRPWLQFRLRTLLLLVTVVAVGPGGWVLYGQHKARREKAAAGALQAVGGNVEVYARPNRLWTWIAPDASSNVVGLGFRYNRALTGGDLAPVADLSELVWLDLQQTRIGDAALMHLAGLQKLERLRLDETHVTDAGLVHLAGLSQLRTLNLCHTSITDAGLIHLAKLQSLEDLYLQTSQVSDEAVARLKAALPNVTVHLLPL